MHEKSIFQIFLVQISDKLLYMVRFNGSLVAFALDAPPCAFLKDAT